MLKGILAEKLLLQDRQYINSLTEAKWLLGEQSIMRN
jgi:hypothetical protein